MRRRGLVLVALGLALGCEKPRAVLTGRQLLGAPAEHAEERVVLVGTVQNPRKRTPPVGDVHTEFTLADGTARVPVVAWGTEPVSSGDLVEVRGVFHDEMPLGDGVRDDVVEAKFVRVLRAAPQPPGTPVGPP